MREILFKAKRIDDGEWVEGYVFDDGFADSKRLFVGGLVIMDYKGTADDRWNVGTAFYEVIPDTICQYTGLTDKNGRKIWENDIVRHEDLTNGRYIARKQPMKNSVIKWNCKEVKFERSDRRDIYKPESRLEVIGNIFDNADLLGE